MTFLTKGKLYSWEEATETANLPGILPSVTSVGRSPHSRGPTSESKGFLQQLNILEDLQHRPFYATTREKEHSTSPVYQ